MYNNIRNNNILRKLLTIDVIETTLYV